MWADTLLAAERAHLLRLAVWAAGSILVGTAIIAALRLKGRASPLMLHFGVQSAAWGVVDLLIAWAANGSLVLRKNCHAESLCSSSIACFTRTASCVASRASALGGRSACRSF